MKLLIEFGVYPYEARSNRTPDQSKFVADFKGATNEMLLLSKLFTRYLSEWNIKHAQKVSVCIVLSQEEEGCSSTGSLTKVALIHKHLLVGRLMQVQQGDRLTFFATFLRNALISGAEKYGWPKDPIEVAYQEIVKASFFNEDVLIPWTKSPKSTRSARVVSRFYIEKTSIVLVVDDGAGNQEQVAIIDVTPMFDSFDFIGKLIWNDENTVTVTDDQGEMSFVCNLGSGTVDVIVEPKRNSQRYLDATLKIWNPNTSDTERQHLFNETIEMLRNGE